MKFRDAIVTSRIDGESIVAQVVVCDECDGDSFHHYAINSQTHLQCTNCGMTFCGHEGICATKLPAEKDS